MDFVTTLHDIFPQVDRAIIEHYIDEIGNETDEEFAMISDMILTYIKNNLETPNALINSNDTRVINDRFYKNKKIGNGGLVLLNQNIMNRKPRDRIERVPNYLNGRSVNVEVSRNTGAIPKRPVRLNGPSSPVITGGGTKNKHYSKMTLVHNTVPHFIDVNENTDFLNNSTVEEENKIFEHFINMLPQADPTYLKEMAKYYQSHPSECADDFILEKIEKNNYPSIKEYLGKLDDINAAKTLTTNFNLQNFIKQFPNAPEHFAKIENPYSTDEQLNKDEKDYVLNQFLNTYRKQRATDIEKIYKRNKYNIIKTSDNLDTRRDQLFEDRPFLSEKVKCANVVLLQMIAYIKHRRKVDAKIYEEAERLQYARAEASASNSFLECACCFRDDLLPEDCVTCIEGCLFCMECVRSGAEHCLAEAKTQYKCLSECTSSFTDGTLRRVLAPIAYQRLTQRRQMEEVAQADITGLETCPFCEYATIPADEDKIFQCENIDCKKASCRKCRHESHLPLRCEEIEYDEDVRLRTTIENRMTEAMLRFKCARCLKPIIKEDGCNKMTCPCGQLSCYVCKKAIRGYDHFSNTGCPLWANAEVTRADILRQANAAKEELGVKSNPEKLKFDPTRNF